jgi:hypothetical protein
VNINNNRTDNLQSEVVTSISVNNCYQNPTTILILATCSKINRIYRAVAVQGKEFHKQLIPISPHKMRGSLSKDHFLVWPSSATHINGDLQTEHPWLVRKVELLTFHYLHGNLEPHFRFILDDDLTSDRFLFSPARC